MGLAVMHTAHYILHRPLPAANPPNSYRRRERPGTWRFQVQRDLRDRWDRRPAVQSFSFSIFVAIVVPIIVDNDKTKATTQDTSRDGRTRWTTTTTGLFQTVRTLLLL